MSDDKTAKKPSKKVAKKAATKKKVTKAKVAKKPKTKYDRAKLAGKGQKISVIVEHKTMQKLRKAAKSQHCSVSEAIRQVLREWASK